MEMIIKDTPKRLEFGMEGNWGTLVPEDVKIEVFDTDHLCAVITYNYGKNDDRTINLCHDDLLEVDYESFGTTFETELNKLGYKRNEVQDLGKRWYIIRLEDGTVVPYAKYKVSFDRISSLLILLLEHLILSLPLGLGDSWFHVTFIFISLST